MNRKCRTLSVARVCAPSRVIAAIKASGIPRPWASPSWCTSSTARCEAVVDSFKEEGRLRRVQVTIWVERESHKAIVIGKQGATLKRISTGARQDMERLFGGKVFLEVWVKVRKQWTEDERMLRELGYG